MAGAAPTEIRSIDQQETDFHNKVARSVERMTGSPTPSGSLKPEDETPLDKIGEEIGNLTQYTTSSIGEKFSGKGTDADVMLSKGNEAITIARKRGLGMRFLTKLGLRKAS